MVKDLFRAFEECPYDTTKVVIVGQDPYPQIGIADGIAFSCSNTGKIEKSLEYIFKSIKETYNPEYTEDPDLKRWANQGVLLINSAFTVTLNKPGAHQLLWKPFTTTLLDYLVWNKQDLIYVFLGKKAAEYAEIVPENNLKIFLSHPASAAYNNEEKWDCGDVWNKINKQLEAYDSSRVDW
jgi:uracil-DNA glycosylase